MLMSNKNMRICVIGAGPGGLSAALALQKAGYKSVMVMERGSRVGGQVFSKSYTTPDNRSIIYEQCALQPMGSKHLNAIIAEHGIKYEPARRVEIHSQCEQKVIFGRKRSETFSLGLAADLVKLSRILYRYRALKKPGFHIEAPLDELAIPFSDWIDQQNFGPALYALLRYSLGGLISFNKPEHSPPALYGLKILMQAFVPPLRYVNGKLVLVHGGYQEIWNRVAKRLDVRMNVAIKHVERKADGVTVHVGEQQFHFDKVIVACQEYRHFLDCTPDELLIAERRRSVGSLRAAFIAQHCPLSDMVLSLDVIARRRNDLCIGITGYDTFGDGYRLMTASYVLSNPNSDLEAQVRAHTEATLNYLGGSLVKMISVHSNPDYGSYFETSDILSGIFSRSEARQGQHHTYFVGETLSCGTNALVVDYAFDLMRRHF